MLNPAFGKQVQHFLVLLYRRYFYFSQANGFLIALSKGAYKSATMIAFRVAVPKTIGTYAAIALGSDLMNTNKSTVNKPPEQAA